MLTPLPALPAGAEVLGQLVGDQSLERFRHEYEALLAALRTAQQSEQRLKAKCAALHEQIVRTTTPITPAGRLVEVRADCWP